MTLLKVTPLTATKRCYGFAVSFSFFCMFRAIPCDTLWRLLCGTRGCSYHVRLTQSFPQRFLVDLSHIRNCVVPRFQREVNCSSKTYINVASNCFTSFCSPGYSQITLSILKGDLYSSDTLPVTPPPTPLFPFSPSKCISPSPAHSPSSPPS